MRKSDGYVVIMIDGKSYQAHRLAWLYIYEKWPDNMIDHLNTIRDDNRITNLRDVEHNINIQNQRRAQKNNKSAGLLGVTFNKLAQKYVAQIKLNGKNKYLGLFDNAEDAHEAYLEAKRQYHAGCTI